MIEYIRKLFCKHNYTTTVGLGIYEEKKNRSPLHFYPVTKRTCIKCKREDYLLPEKEIK